MSKGGRGMLKNLTLGLCLLLLAACAPSEQVVATAAGDFEMLARLEAQRAALEARLRE